eukprot:gene14742-19816_t
MERNSDSVFLFIATSLSVIFACNYTHNLNKRKIKENKSAQNSNEDLDFDVIIVGAGPAGSTAAYYLTNSSINGKKNLRVGLFDKKSFPRAKPCGDAWCAPALEILHEMGILNKMEKDGIVHQVKRGGFISPFGYQCINSDGNSKYGEVTGCKTYAIKRFIADEYIVKAAAAQPDCHLYENSEITNAEFVSNKNHWLVTVQKEKDSSEIKFKTKLLFICDGSLSYLGQKLGIIPSGSQPEAVCSHAYVKGGSHAWESADGVMIFNKSMLPGYSALFKHYDGDMYLGTYILPGGKATSRSIAPFENDVIEQHPYIKDAFGNKYLWNERRIVAPIRLGGIPKSYDQQLLIIGDAAGHVDPLTGEGIHTAMIAGKIAAISTIEMFEKNNFSLESCEAYALRCYDNFGYEFLYSSIAARVIYYFPITLDAVACVGQRRGQAFLDFFGEVMTGVKPKSAFLQIDLLFDIIVEIGRQFFIQYIFRYPSLIPNNIGMDMVNKQQYQSKKK